MSQSYINAILDCLETRKHCKTIMDDVLPFYSHKESTHGKIRRFLKSFIKEWAQNISKKVPII